MDGVTGSLFYGVLLYELISGRHPFRKRVDASEDEIVGAILTNHPLPVHDLAPDCPPVLSDLIHKALEKAP